MYLSPAIEERQYVVVLNDGNERSTPKGERPKDSTLLLIDAAQSSPTFLKPMGEARLGIGHHKSELLDQTSAPGGLQYLRLLGCRLDLRLSESFGHQTGQDFFGRRPRLRRLNAAQDLR